MRATRCHYAGYCARRGLRRFDDAVYYERRLMLENTLYALVHYMPMLLFAADAAAAAMPRHAATCATRVDMLSMRARGMLR